MISSSKDKVEIYKDSLNPNNSVILLTDAISNLSSTELKSTILGQLLLRLSQRLHLGQSTQLHPELLDVLSWLISQRHPFIPFSLSFLLRSVSPLV